MLHMLKRDWINFILLFQIDHSEILLIWICWTAGQRLWLFGRKRESEWGLIRKFASIRKIFSLAPSDDENYPITIDACHDRGQTTIIKH
jgi:hypothetical protein